LLEYNSGIYEADAKMLDSNGLAVVAAVAAVGLAAVAAVDVLALEPRRASQVPTRDYEVDEFHSKL
jgi:hypothetical protein